MNYSVRLDLTENFDGTDSASAVIESSEESPVHFQMSTELFNLVLVLLAVEQGAI